MPIIYPPPPDACTAIPATSIPVRANVEASVSPTSEGNRTGTPDVPVLCNKRKEGNEDRQGPVDLLPPVSQDPPTKFPARTDLSTRQGVSDPRTPRHSGRRKRKRGQTRRRRARRNDLADRVAPKVVDGIVCLMTSKIYNVLGSVATGSNAFKPHTIAVDTCSTYNLVRRPELPPDWNRYVIRDAPLPRLAGLNSNPLRLTVVVRLAVRLQNTKFCITFVVAEQLAATVLLGTAFIDAHVRSIDIDGQKLELRQNGSVAIVDGNRGPNPPTRRHGRQTSRPEVCKEAPQASRIARRVTIPAMSQARGRVTIVGRGLVFLEPKPSLQPRHGVKLTNGVAEVLPNQTFDVVVAIFSQCGRRLPKYTVVGYAKRNPLAILTPE